MGMSRRGVGLGWVGKGWGVGGDCQSQGEVQAALRSIPSAREQPKRLMKCESAVKSVFSKE